jgi:hypothetical protein
MWSFKWLHDLAKLRTEQYAIEEYISESVDEVLKQVPVEIEKISEEAAIAQIKARIMAAEPTVIRNRSQLTDWYTWDKRRTKFLYPSFYHTCPVMDRSWYVKPMIYSDIDGTTLSAANNDFQTRRRIAIPEDFGIC